MQNTPSIESIRKMVEDDPAFAPPELPPPPKGNKVIAVILFAVQILLCFWMIGTGLSVFAAKADLPGPFTGEDTLGDPKTEHLVIFALATFGAIAALRMWILEFRDKITNRPMLVYQQQVEQINQEQATRVKEEFERLILLSRGLDPVSISERDKEREKELEIARMQLGYTAEAAQRAREAVDKDREKELEIANLQALMKQYELDRNYEHLASGFAHEAAMAEAKRKAENPSPEERNAARQQAFAAKQELLKWADKNLKGNERAAFKEQVMREW